MQLDIILKHIMFEGTEAEFRRLCAFKVAGLTAFRVVSANLPANKYKNRLVNVVPYESARVVLSSIRGVEGSDYINASWVDGYRTQRAYIATQAPLAETLEDLWRMIWETRCSLIVMLTKLREMGRVC